MTQKDDTITDPCHIMLKQTCSRLKSLAPIVLGHFPKCQEFWSLESVPFQEKDFYGYLWHLAAICGTFAEHVAPKDEVPFYVQEL
jgi:hypothetical protein